MKAVFVAAGKNLMNRCGLFLRLLAAGGLLGIAGAFGRCDTPVTSAEQAAGLAPTASQALGACAYTYIHLKTYHCRIHESDQADGKPNGSSDAEVWFQHPGHLRINSSEIYPVSGAKPSPSLYVSDGKSGHLYSVGHWTSPPEFNQAYTIASAAYWIPELLLNGDGGNILKIAYHSQPSVASGMVNGRECWQVSTGASISSAVSGGINAKSTHGLINSLDDRQLLSIDKENFLIDRYETIATINGAHLDMVQTITASQLNSSVPLQLFTYNKRLHP